MFQTNDQKCVDLGIKHSLLSNVSHSHRCACEDDNVTFTLVQWHQKINVVNSQKSYQHNREIFESLTWF